MRDEVETIIHASPTTPAVVSPAAANTEPRNGSRRVPLRRSASTAPTSTTPKVSSTATHGATCASSAARFTGSVMPATLASRPPTLLSGATRRRYTTSTKTITVVAISASERRLLSARKTAASTRRRRGLRAEGSAGLVVAWVMSRGMVAQERRAAQGEADARAPKRAQATSEWASPETVLRGRVSPSAALRPSWRRRRVRRAQGAQASLPPGGSSGGRATRSPARRRRSTSTCRSRCR